MATTKKLGPVTRHYPPQEIRSDTKARRAWLAATAAAIAAQPGMQAKVVGIGSYQHVSARTVTEVAVRTQLRGTCQICCRQQAVTPQGIALHGYKRPRYGFLVGRCNGSEYPPAEHDLTQTHRALAGIPPTVARWEGEAQAFRVTAAGIEIPHELWQTDRPTALERLAKRRAAEKEAHNLELNIRYLKQYGEDLRTYVLPRHGQPLVEVPVL